MSNKYVLLECNRLRSKELESSIKQDDDPYQNRWTNTISSSGIRINTGDVINVQQSIINTQGASDEVIEFTGDPNLQGFIDNKTQLTFSYYVNHTGRNTFAMPSLYHRCFNGIGTTVDPTLVNQHPVTNAYTLQTTNHNPSVFFMRQMLACRSLGEMFFSPLKVDGSNLVFEGGTPTATNRYNGRFYPNYFNANYIFRFRVSQTGFGTGATDGYFPNFVYPVRIYKSGNNYNVENITGGDVGDTTFECDWVRQVVADSTDPTGYRVYNETKTVLFGTIQSITNDRVRMTVTLTSALTADLKTAGIVIFSPLAAAAITDIGWESGLRIRVLETTGPEADLPNAITKFEIAELDIDRPNAISKNDLLIMSVDVSGGGSPYLPDANQQKFRVESIIDQAGFCSAQTDGVDGARYTLIKDSYTGLVNPDEASGADNSDNVDIVTMDNNLDKRKTTIDLEMKPSFATPDNVGTILSDQLSAPKQLSLDDPEDDFFNLTGTDYTFKQNQPRGALLDTVSDALPSRARFQSSDTLKPKPKPAFITTPTYKPVIPNMYGKGIPDVDFNGEKRNGDQSTYAGLRRMFYSSLAYKDMDRVVGLKHAFYDYDYPYTADGGNTNYGRDIYPLTALEEFEAQDASQRTFGDFGNQPMGMLGNRVCFLSKFPDDSTNPQQVVLGAPKHSLIVTNMKFNRSNISRISTGFRRVEKYLGDLSQKVDTASDDFKQKVAVNLDLGMYNDELSTNGKLQVYTGAEDPPEANQRRRYGTAYESSVGLIVDSVPQVDLVANSLGGFQRDFNNLANDNQELSSIWVKSRWQEGFTYQNTKNRITGYTGDYMSDPSAFITRQADARFYATDFPESPLINEPADPAEDIRFIILSANDHTTPLAPLSTSDALYEQPYRVGQTIIITEGTIDGADATGRTAVIQGVDMKHILPSTVVVRQLELAGDGFGSRATAGMVGVNIKIVKTATETDFFEGTWTSDGTDSLDQEYAYNLSREFDVACVPVFQPIDNPDTKTSGWRQDDNVPLIAFISNYQLGHMDPEDFNLSNLGDDNNLWQIDNYNGRQGFQIGFDPSFTRNKAVAICNTQYGNLNTSFFTVTAEPDAPKNAYVNVMYAGATAPQIEFNSELSRFEISGLNTPFTVGNGLPTDLPENLIANPTPEQQVYAINKKGRIYPAEAKLVGAIAGIVTGRRIAVYDQFTSVQEYGTIMDSQSGLAIEGIGVYDTLGNLTQLTENDSDKFEDTMLHKLGFDLNQLLIEIGDSQNFFINNFIFQDVFTYEKTLKSFIKPITTGAYISSAQIQAVSLNQVSMPLFDLGTDTCILEATPDATQGAITAFRLPKKLDFPYLVVYSSITGGSCDTHFIGGSDSQSLLPAVAYIYRNENNGDYYYSLESDITFTAVKDFTLTDVEIDIRRPDGKRPRLNPHSAVIFKITKPLAVPNPELILGIKK